MTIVHPGLFFLRVRDKYERVQTIPTLPPAREAYEGVSAVPTFAFGLAEPDEVPRAWYVSGDDTMIVQLQSDRLLLNWRRGAGVAEYPHFESVSSEFRRLYSELERFCSEEGLGSVDPDQCEMTYINHLTPSEATSQLDASNFLRVWTAETGPEWSVPVEDLFFRTRYVLRDQAGNPHGRLIAALSTARIQSPDEPSRRIFQFEITVRGDPGTGGKDAVVAFHEMAHRKIVRYFASVTTKAAHSQWERWQ